MSTLYKYVFIVSVVLISLSISAAAWSDSPADNSSRPETAGSYIAGGDDALEQGLTLAECIEFGLRNNLGVRAARYDPKIAATAIIEAKAEFDVVYSLTYAFTDKDFPSSTVLDGAAVLRQKSHQVDTKITKKLLTGGSIEFGFFTNHQKSNSIFATVNPRSDSYFNFSVVQRLLRGFGPEYNRSQIDTAQNQKKIEDLRFEKEVLDVAFRIEQAYWRYVGFVHDLRVQDEAIKTAEETLSEVTKRLEKGRALEIEKLEAEEDFENRKLVRLVIDKKVDDSRDELIRLIESYSEDVHWNEKIYVPALLGQRKADTDLKKNVKTALENRQELLQAELIIENLGIERRVAKNEMLPTFNLGFEMTWQGLDYQTYNSVRDISIDRYVNEQLTAYFEYPLFNRSAKSRFLRARYNLDRAMIDVDSLRMDVTMDVRTAARGVNVARDAIEVARRSAELAGKKVKVERKRYELGRTTLHNTLEYEQERVRAESLYIHAKIEYELSLNQLERATATTLKKYNMEDTIQDKTAAGTLADSKKHVDRTVERNSTGGEGR